MAELATQQHGVVSLAQLAAIGITKDAVAHRIAAGRLHRIHRGVYAVGHRHLDLHGQRVALVLASGPGAVLSHQTAAEVWGIGGGTARWHVTAPGLSGGRLGPLWAIVHRTRHFDASDVANVDGIAVTSVARTLLDLAGVLRPQGLASAIHEAERLRLLDVAAVHAIMERIPRRRGAAHLRSLLASPDPTVSHERFVQAFLQLCSRHGLPQPEVGVYLHTAERLVEADIFFRTQRLVLELDGEQSHHTRRNFHSDRRRDAALAAEGIQTIRLTWQRVTREAPSTATELRRILASRH